MDGRTGEWTERRKLYTPRHTSYARGKNILSSYHIYIKLIKGFRNYEIIFFNITKDMDTITKTMKYKVDHQIMKTSDYFISYVLQ